MRKIFTFIFFTSIFCLYASEVSALYAEVSQGKQLTTGSAKSAKGDGENIDGDLDSVLAQKFLENYKIRNLLKIENLFSLGLLLIRLIVILSIFMALWKMINRFTASFVTSIIKSYKKKENAHSLASTAGPILNSVLHWTLICITSLIILTEIGVDIMPIIYSFGVLGLAISIGAQTLVKDIISGILTLFEGIISIGEVVEINGSIGTVEAMSLRSIEFRHSNGKMQIISFSEINSLINLSRDYAICNIVVPVGHEADIQIVEKAYYEAFQIMKKSENWKNIIIGEINLKGLTSITETAVYLSAYVRTKPDPYDFFGKEFRKILFNKMKEYKIPAPKFTGVMMEK